MSTIRNISNGIKIIERTIRTHGTTADTDKQGYLVSNGTNRTLCTAIDTDGLLNVYAETNGCPVLLGDDNAAEFCATIGDNYDIESGRARLSSIVDGIREESEEWAQWIEGCVESAV